MRAMKLVVVLTLAITSIANGAAEARPDAPRRTVGFADVLSRTRVPLEPLSIATGAGSVWVGGDLGVSRVDPTTDSIVATVSVGGVAAVAADRLGVWISSYASDEVARVDPDSNDIAWSTHVVGPVNIAIGDHALWVLSSVAGTVTRLDPATGEVQDTITVQRRLPARLGFGSESANPGFFPGLSVGSGGVWVAVRSEDRVVRIDPITDRVTARVWAGGVEPLAVTARGGEVWVSDYWQQIVSRIDPTTLRVRTYGVPDYVQQIAFGAGDVWMGTYHFSEDGTGSAGILRVDPGSGRVERYLKIRPVSAGGYWAITSGFGDLWVTTSHFEEAVDDVLYRIDPTRELPRPSIPPMVELPTGLFPVTVTQQIPMTSGHQCERPGPHCLQSTDVYAPSTSGLHPVIVLAHETCGDAGCKRYLANLAEVLTQEGSVVFNPDFGDPQGFVSEGGLKFTDLACAVRFARVHAAEFGGDPEDVTLVTHLSASRRGGVIALDGDEFVGPTCLAQEGSALPDTFVGLGDAPAVGKMPPIGADNGVRFDLVLGSRDRDIEPDAAERIQAFLDALAGSGFDATMTVIPHATFAAPMGWGAIDVGSQKGIVQTILAATGH